MQHVSWFHPSLDLVYPILKMFMKWTKLRIADRPAALALIPKFKSRFMFMTAKLFKVSILKAHTQPFEDDGVLLEPIETPFLILSTIPADDLRIRLQKLNEKVVKSN
ncbi:unnamed protein product [Amoebophrya sp. A120]|nr:unnamed protein product [Amoebophrya sp. A120]|eukprot:GSA120T00014225001.1